MGAEAAATVRVTFTEDEAEIAILAIETYMREHSGDYADETRTEIRRDCRSAAAKLRDAA